MKIYLAIVLGLLFVAAIRLYQIVHHFLYIEKD
jgi:hypothetical protein